MSPADRVALVAIAECVARARTYVEQAGATWARNDMAVDAVAKRLEEIGELAKRVDPETLGLMPAADWRGIKGMREILAHDYGHVHIAIIESVIADDLDALSDSIQRLLGAPDA